MVYTNELKVMVCSLKCRKTHPCDYRISKFSWGACPRNPLGGKPSRPCQFFAQVSNSVALLFKTLMNPPVVHFITHENKPCNLIRCSRQVRTWVVKWATSLFNLFCSNVTTENKSHVFGSPFYCSSKQQSFNESGPLSLFTNRMNERVL